MEGGEKIEGPGECNGGRKDEWGGGNRGGGSKLRGEREGGEAEKRKWWSGRERGRVCSEGGTGRCNAGEG